MLKSFCICVILLLAIDGAVFPEVGMGIIAAYPIGAVNMYMDNYGSEIDPRRPLFVGPTFRWKPSALFIDIGGKYWPYGGMIHGNMNIGLCGDLSFFRFGISGGFDAVVLPNPGSGSIVAFGRTAKLYIDIKIKQFTVGTSIELPMDMLKNVRTYGQAFIYPFDELRIYAGQVSVNVIYWF